MSPQTLKNQLLLPFTFRVRQSDFKWCAITYAKSATNVRLILPKNLTHFWDFYEYVPFKMLVFAVFCKESRIWAGKKLIPTKQSSVFFTVSFVLESHVENTRSNHAGISLKCFFRKSANPWKEPVKDCFLVTPTINACKDILPRVFLEFRVISDNFLKC